jgi:hypothetical protein
MPAPRRPGLLQQTVPANSVYTTPGALVDGAPANTRPVTMARPGAPVSQHEMDMMKVSQTVMMAFGFLTIWGGVFIIAYDENATNTNMLVVFLAGLLSFAATMGAIETQSRKNGGQLYDLHNYFLGIAFFFSTIAAMWGARYAMAFATGTLDMSLFGDPDAYANSDWAPNATGIYAQTLAVVGVSLLHLQLLNRYEGEKSFGYGVATYAPMVVLLGGVGPWIRWSENVVSYELGISMLVLTVLAMEMAVRSNRSMNFTIVAFVAGLMPALYEVLNTNAPPGGEGGALSLMVFIVALQGYYASREDLSKEVMERASGYLIAQAVLVIFLTRGMDLNLILGPLNVVEQPELQPFLSIPVMLWCTVLLAYFPAVLANRVPWMPIGLAVALPLMPMDGSTVPWALAAAMIPYMVFISKVARPWVVNATLVLAAGAYLLTDIMGYLAGHSPLDTFGGHGVHLILPWMLVLVAEFGRRDGRLQTTTSLAMLTSVLMSRAFWDPAWFVPWAFIIYMLGITVSKVQRTPNPTFDQRKDITYSMFFAGAAAAFFGVSGGLTFPTAEMNEALQPYGFGAPYLALSLVFYTTSKFTAKHELSLFGIGRVVARAAGAGPRYDAESNTWVVDEAKPMTYDDSEWSSLERASIITSFVLFTCSIVALDPMALLDQPLWVCLMVVPVAMLVKEINDMEVISSRTRSTGVWLLLLMCLPLTFKLIVAKDAGPYLDNEYGLATGVLFDLIVLSGPLAVNAIINRRGIDESAIKRSADVEAYIGLILLAMLDASGGLLFLTLTGFVAVKTLQHKVYTTGMLVPLAYLLRSDGWVTQTGLAKTMLDRLPSGMAESLSSYTDVGAFVGLSSLVVVTHMVFALGIMERDKETDTFLPSFLALGWLGLACLSLIPNGAMLPTFATVVAMIFTWQHGRAQFLPPLLGVLFFSMAFSIGFSETGESMTGTEILSLSALGTGIVGSLLHGLHKQGRLFREPTDDTHERMRREDTAALLLQMASVAFLLAFDVTFGVGPIIGAAMYAKASLDAGRANQLILFPVLSSFAVFNAFGQLGLDEGNLRTMSTGALLIAQGLFMTLMTNREDEIYDNRTFEWPNDDDFFAFMDRMGMTATLYTLVGGAMAFAQFNESVAFLVATVYLVSVGIQGFSETGSVKWRRSIGGYGSILTAIMFTSTVDANIYRGLSVMMTGVIALGFTFLYMQRTGGGGTQITGGSVDGASMAAPLTQAHATASAAAAVSTGAMASSGGEASDDEPVPVKASQGAAAEDFDVLPDEDHDHGEDAEAEATSAGAPSLHERKKQKLAQAKQGTWREPATPVAVPAPTKQVLMTEHGLGIELPEGTLENILLALKSTPHAGYTPVLSFGSGGQIMLNFEEM